MSKKITREYARYRTNGFIIDLISKGLGVEQKEEKLQKIYQRFIKEQDLAVDEYHDTFNTLIEDILLIFFDNNQSLEYEEAELLVQEFFKLFNLVKTTNEVLASSQKQLDFIVLMTLFIPFISFNKFNSRLIIARIIPDKNENSIQKLFNLIEPSFNKSIKELIKSVIVNKKKSLGYDSIDKLINNWLKGNSIPDNIHIEYISEIVNEDSNNPMPKNELKNFLFLAKILDFLFNKAKEYFGDELSNLLATHYEAMFNFKQLYTIHKSKEQFENVLKKQYPYEPFSNIKRYLEIYFYKNISLMSEIDNQSSTKDKYIPSKYNEYIKEIYDNVDLYYYMNEKDFFDTIYCSIPTIFYDEKHLCGKPMNDSLRDKELMKYSGYSGKLYINTSINGTKNQEKEKELILGFTEFEKNYHIDEDPYYNFLKGRYYAQKKDIKKSIKHYLIALKYGKNCIGSHIKDVIKEGLFVSSQDTRKKELDLINAKSDFTKFYKEAYFFNLIKDLPNEISMHFLQRMQRKFDSYFVNLYPHTTKTKDSKVVKNIKIDLKKPNKLIKNPNGADLPQLFYFASIGNIQAVKDLIKHKVDISYVRKYDNLTVLISIVSGGISDNVGQIAKILIPKMTPLAINSRLIRKKETALSYAIRRGLVDIVDLLIKHRANLEEKDTLDEISALYHSIKVIGLLKMDDNKNILADDGKFKINNPNDSKEERKKMINTHDYLSVIFDDEKEQMLDKMSNDNILPNHIREHMQTIGFIKKNFYHDSLKNAYKIFDLIIDSSKKVDIPHKNNFSPLVYATELNEKYLVERLLEKGANPDWTLDAGLIAYDYAQKNNNLEIMEMLGEY